MLLVTIALVCSALLLYGGASSGSVGDATDGSEIPFPPVPGVLMKPGVDYSGIRAETVKAITVTRDEFHRLGFGPLVVTSVRDGVHLPTSLHYKGLAFDGRTRHLAVDQRQLVTAAVRAKLGDAYDVLNEGPGPGHDVQNPAAHLHEEYDP